jgi:O-glycosyl hydrolase
MLKVKPILIVLGLALIVVACLNAVSNVQAVITLDPNTKYQTISGWEATAQVGQTDFPEQYQKWRDTVLDMAANDLGINRVRVEIKSGTENPVDYWTQYINGQISRDVWKQHWFDIVNDNNDPNVINPSGFQFSDLDAKIDSVVLPLKQRVEANGEHLFINVDYVDFGSSTFEHKDHPDEYAEFVLATYQHLQSKYGWVPDAWEVILEPDTGTASWSGTQIGNCVAAAAAMLVAHGFTPHFILPSTTDMGNAVPMFNQAVAVAGVLPYVSEISYHRYGGVSDSNLQAIANRAKQLGIDTAMLEHIGSSYEDLHQDLKVGMNSAWQQFTLSYPTDDNGAQYYTIGLSNPNNPTITMGSRTKYLRQYFKFIRAGAVRIGAGSDNGAMDPLAFINTNGKYVVVIKASQGGSFSIQGLPVGTYGIKYTTDTQYNIDITPDVVLNSGQSLTASIPDKGVITIYAQSANGTGITPTSEPSGRMHIYVPVVVNKNQPVSVQSRSASPVQTTQGLQPTPVSQSKGSDSGCLLTRLFGP